MSWDPWGSGDEIESLITGLPVYFSAHAHVSGVVNPQMIADLFLLGHHVYVVQYVSTCVYLFLYFKYISTVL